MSISFRMKTRVLPEFGSPHMICTLPPRLLPQPVSLHPCLHFSPATWLLCCSFRCTKYAPRSGSLYLLFPWLGHLPMLLSFLDSTYFLSHFHYFLNPHPIVIFSFTVLKILHICWFIIYYKLHDNRVFIYCCIPRPRTMPGM